jgi:hypothetical protein
MAFLFLETKSLNDGAVGGLQQGAGMGAFFLHDLFFQTS